MRAISLTAALTVFCGGLSAQVFTESFALSTTSGRPLGLESDGNGRLLFTAVGAGGEFGVATTTGTLLNAFPIATNSGSPNGITRDDTGTIFVTDTVGRDVDVYDSAGTFLRSFDVSSQTGFPEGITFNPNSGNLYIVDGSFRGNTVYEFTRAGAVVASFPLNGTSADGIAYDALLNRYWIYDSGTDTLRSYNDRFIQQSAVPGTNANGVGQGEGVAVTATKVLVCAPISSQVAVFRKGTMGSSSVSYGTGCGSLDLVAVTPPVVCSEFVLQLNGIAPTALSSVALVGVTRTNISFPGGLPSGCRLLTDGLFGSLPLSSAGQGSVRIPEDLNLIGRALTWQGVMLDPSLSSASTPVFGSNGLETTIGDF